jgi:hypothetical protein
MHRPPSLRTIAVVVLTSATSVAAADLVRPDGVGALRVGMTIPALERVLKQRIEVPKDPEDGHCFYAEPKAHPKLSLMIESGRLRRIDIREAGVATNDGIQVGDSVEKVKAKYGTRLKIEPHFYSGPEDKYLTVTFSSGRLATRFETHNDLIDSIYSGSFKQVQYVEGCL